MASEPFLAAADPSARQQLSHMADFGLAYLAASNLIDNTGRPVGLAGLVCLLFWTDPANFVFARLLSSGAVHKLVQKYEGQALLDSLLLLLSGLFERVPLHPLQVKHCQGAARRESPSVVVLTELPPEVSVIISEHNQQVFQILLRVLKQQMAAEAADSSAELALPLSGITLSAHDMDPSSALWQALAATAVPAVLASPFMALSGYGDAFNSLSELLLAGKQGLRLFPGSVPLLALQDRRGRELELNAWALDYFKHGQRSALVTANGLLEGDAWQRLKSMSSIMAAISLSIGAAVEADGTAAQGTPDSSLSETVLEAAGNQQVAAAFAALAAAFHERFKGFNGNGVVYGTAAVQHPQQNKPHW